MNENVNINDLLSDFMQERKVPMANDAASAGLFLGVGLGIIGLIDGFVMGSIVASFILNVFAWILFVLVLQMALRARVIKRGKPVLDMVEAWGYTVLVSFFAGIIFGLVRYIVFRYIAHDFFAELYDSVIQSIREVEAAQNVGTILTPEMLSVMDRLWNAPVTWFVGGLVNVVFTGALVGLVISAVGRRNPLTMR
ncbi:MAG: DUF4199 domain-containing protein [Rikenellaceae bacterium]|nr:DUF4199 domain-containing protein [Rikenellaceae bacterium]MDE7356449.1 DUF4199 domain-containing protein [Rikenellaceae bacterium]